VKFFSKHYEKLLLAALLLVFVILLVFLLNIIKSASNISERDLAIRPPKADYEPVDFNDPMFRLRDVFQLKVNWRPYGTRLVDADGHQLQGIPLENVTDLLIPYKAAACPSCKRVIPLYNFTTLGRCMVCGSRLSRPGTSFNDEADFTIRSSDSDGDGMPNIFELKYSSFLNPNYDGDAREDHDRDGFSNLYEYICGTNPDDPKDHPPLTDLIYIESARPPQFNGELVSVDQDGGKVKIKDLSRTTGRPRDYSVGAEFKLDRRDYRILEIIDANAVRMELPAAGKEFVLRVGETADLPIEEISIMNLGTNRPFTGVKVGTVIEIGNTQSGKEKWTVVSLDMANAQATLEGPGGQTYELTTQSQIPTRARLSR